MGAGARFRVINGTTHQWVVMANGERKMSNDTQRFWKAINAWNYKELYIEFDSEWPADDEEMWVEYTIQAGETFVIHADGKSGQWRFWIELKGLEVMNYDRNSKIDLGFHHYGNGENGEGYDKITTFALFGSNVLKPMYFLVGGDQSTLAPNWMEHTLPWMGASLRDICLPGSHNSGMGGWGMGVIPRLVSPLVDSTKAKIPVEQATPESNTNGIVTQYYNILGQLRRGIRFLDIQPVLYNGAYYSGWGKHDNKLRLGQRIQDIIDEVNYFNSQYNELIVFHVSAGVNMDGVSRRFNVDEWKNLLSLLTSLEKRYCGQVDQLVNEDDENPSQSQRKGDLTHATMKVFWDGSKAAVLVILPWSEDNNEHTMAPYKNGESGFWYQKHYPMYAEGGNLTDPQKVINGQLECLNRAQPHDRDPNNICLNWWMGFEASWAGVAKHIFDEAKSQDWDTLIKDAGNAFSIWVRNLPALRSTNMVMDRQLLDSRRLEPAMLSDLIANCGPSKCPNILLISGVDGCEAAAVSWAATMRAKGMFSAAP